MSNVKLKDYLEESRVNFSLLVGKVKRVYIVTNENPDTDTRIAISILETNLIKQAQFLTYSIVYGNDTPWENESKNSALIIYLQSDFHKKTLLQTHKNQHIHVLDRRISRVRQIRDYNTEYSTNKLKEFTVTCTNNFSLAAIVWCISSNDIRERTIPYSLLVVNDYFKNLKVFHLDPATLSEDFMEYLRITFKGSQEEIKELLDLTVAEVKEKAMSSHQYVKSKAYCASSLVNRGIVDFNTPVIKDTLVKVNCPIELMDNIGFSLDIPFKCLVTYEIIKDKIYVRIYFKEECKNTRVVFSNMAKKAVDFTHDENYLGFSATIKPKSIFNTPIEKFTNSLLFN